GRVLARAARQLVGSRAADEQVVPGSAEQEVVPCPAEELVVAALTLEPVGLGAPAQRVVASRAADRGGADGRGRNRDRKAQDGGGDRRAFLDVHVESSLSAPASKVGASCQAETPRRRSRNTQDVAEQPLLMLETPRTGSPRGSRGRACRARTNAPRSRASRQGGPRGTLRCPPSALRLPR